MRGSQVSDQTITNQVNRKLVNRGVRSPCQVAVQTKNGEVTLTGSVQYVHQKGAAVGAATGIAGVRRVHNQLIVKALDKRSWS